MPLYSRYTHDCFLFKLDERMSDDRVGQIIKNCDKNDDDDDDDNDNDNNNNNNNNNNNSGGSRKIHLGVDSIIRDRRPTSSNGISGKEGRKYFI